MSESNESNIRDESKSQIGATLKNSETTQTTSEDTAMNDESQSGISPQRLNSAGSLQRIREMSAQTLSESDMDLVMTDRSSEVKQTSISEDP